MNRRLRRALASVLLIPAALVLGGCGGKDEKELQGLLDKGFNTPVGSAEVSLEIGISVKGVKQLEEPVRLKLAGPYKSGGRERIPSLDWDVSLRGGGTSFTGGLISTGENAYVTVSGAAYEVGEKPVAQLNRQVAESSRAQPKDRSLKDLGINTSKWLDELEDKGGEKVGGVETTHVAGRVDVRRFVDDLNRVVERAGKGFGQQAAPTLPDNVREQIAKVVKNPEFDVYVSKDGRLRRLSVDLRFAIPEGQRQQAGGAESGTVTFDLEFSSIGKARPIAAPRDARPLSDLRAVLGGLGALGGGGGAGGGATPQPQPAPAPQPAPQLQP